MYNNYFLLFSSALQSVHRMRAVSVMFLPLRLIPVPVQCIILTTILELFFARDASLEPLLGALEGKVFRIHVSDTGVVIFFGFTAEKPWLHPIYKGDVDVHIEATTAAFARMCFAREDPDDLVFQQVLKLSGDSGAMLRFKKLFAAADLDWEQELRSAFGDFFGSRVARAAHALMATEKKLADDSRQVVASSLREMNVPDSERLQDWQAGVEYLSHRISRLKGRVTRSEHKLEHLVHAGDKQ
jgi:ubiquinone biosynthesis protein UbiJ